MEVCQMNIRAIINNVSCFVLILILSFIFLTNTVSAETRTFIKEYTYQASEYDSKVTCRLLALEQVKRLLLEELGTYLESHTEVKNFQLTKDQIIVLTAGVVSAAIIEEKWNGEKYFLKAKIVAEPKDVTMAIDALRKDRSYAKELEEAKQKADEALKEIRRLNKELATAKIDNNKIKLYDKAIEDLKNTKTPPLVGGVLPNIYLAVPKGDKERIYLGLSGEYFKISQIKARVVIIEIFSMYCPYCQQAAPSMNQLYASIEQNPALKGKIKLIGIGAGNDNHEVGIFKVKYNIPFPLFTDQEFFIHNRLGQVRTPYFIAININTDGSHNVIYSRLGAIEDMEQFLAQIIKAAGLG